MRFRTCSLALFVAALACAAVPTSASAAPPPASTLDSIASSAPAATYVLQRSDSVITLRIDSVVSLRGVTTSGALTLTPTRALAQPASAIHNTFARYTPSGEATYAITNPELVGQFKPGDTFYVDFTPADQPSTLAALRETVAGDSAVAG